MASSFPCHTKLGRALVALAVLVGLWLAPVASVGAAALSGYPEPGTYKLARIFKAPNVWVLEDSPWWPHSLARYTSDKVTLLSFFYTLCRDPEGCPVIWSTFEAVHERIEKDPALRGKVRLVFISLDPGVDTPASLEVFSHAYRDTKDIAPWYFLTTWSDRYLGAILGGFGQAAARDLDADGRPGETISHQVKFYLLDKKSWVREIYSSAFAAPEVIENDIRTLLMESGELPTAERHDR